MGDANETVNFTHYVLCWARGYGTELVDFCSYEPRWLVDFLSSVPPMHNYYFVMCTFSTINSKRSIKHTGVVSKFFKVILDIVISASVKNRLTINATGM